MSCLRTGGRNATLALIVCAVFACGCTQLRLPRIDPTGDRIFAEPAVGRNPLSTPRPVYREFPGPSGSGDPAIVVICPRETVAPVGSEVVVLAGVVGPDDYLRTNERVEWMLDPGGPGQFVDLGKCIPTDFLVGDFTRPKKIDNTFAVGSTSRRYLHLTRATATPADDVYVQRGQAWITVTSRSEGTSRVTAYAPNVDDWERRKQTATIHWIDAQWCFPSPAINPAGTRHVFTTTVTRQTDGAPCVDWRVRYEILDGPAAGFAPDGAQAIEVPTDEQGRASAEIFEQQPVAGTNRVAIRVIRPAGPSSGKRLEVGSGCVLKTWSAADLAVRKTGPAVATAGATLAYRIDVSNPGDLPAEGVTLTDEVPDGLAYLRSNPAGEMAGRVVRWQLGTLAAKETRSVEIEFRAERQGSVTNCTQATAAGGLQARDCAATAVSTAAVDLQVTAPRQTVSVGEEVAFSIVVTNRGQVTATGLLIKDRFDAGLEHAEAASPIERDLGVDLAPGQSQRIGVVLRVAKAGRLCNTVDVIGQGRVLATASACVTALEAAGRRTEPEPSPRPIGPVGMSVDMTGPRVATVGESVLFTIEVASTGQRPLSGVSVVSRFDASFHPFEASLGHDRQGDAITWNLDTLPPGQTKQFKVKCECLTAAALASGRVEVTTREGASGDDRVSVEIRPSPAAGPGPAVGPVPALSPADLRMTVTALREPVANGKEFTYVIQVVNHGQSPDHQVAVVVSVPPELQPIKFGTHGPPSTDFVVIGQFIRFMPADTIEPDPGKPLEYRIRVRAVQVGNVRLRAELTSQGLRQPQVVEETTSIFAE